jgi:hypothetical protein
MPIMEKGQANPLFGQTGDLHRRKINDYTPPLPVTQTAPEQYNFERHRTEKEIPDSNPDPGLPHE